jgi:predicted  nucleic acid-binding Zn-ribbon protein
MRKVKGFITLGLTGYLAVAAGVVFALMSAAIWIQTARLDHCVENHANFVASVKAEGEAAKARAKQKELQDFLNKERSDAAYMAELDDLRARVKLLRDRGGSGNHVPAAPAGSSCPQGQACFDRAELERALRNLVGGVRELVDEGSEVSKALKSAREWANGNKGLQGTP